MLSVRDLLEIFIDAEYIKAFFYVLKVCPSPDSMMFFVFFYLSRITPHQALTREGVTFYVSEYGDVRAL